MKPVENVLVKEEKMPVVQSNSAPNIQTEHTANTYNYNYDHQPATIGDSNNIPAYSGNELMQTQSATTLNTNNYYNPVVENSTNFYNPNSVATDSSAKQVPQIVDNPYVSRKSSISTHSDLVITPRDFDRQGYNNKNDFNNHQSYANPTSKTFIKLES